MYYIINQCVKIIDIKMPFFDTPDKNKKIIQLTDKLLDPKSNHVAVKESLLHLLSRWDSAIYRPYRGKTVLHALMTYYTQNHDRDAFSKFIQGISSVEVFSAICHQIFLKRWPHPPKNKFNIICSPQNHTVDLEYTCKQFEEAVLVAHTFDVILKQNYNISPRAAMPGIKPQIGFSRDQQNNILTVMRYRAKDYAPEGNRLTLKPKLELDKKLNECFTNQKADQTTYHNNRALVPPSSFPNKIPQIPTQIPPERYDVHCNIVVVTAIIAGSGNLFFARKILSALVESFPQATFNWILGTSSSSDLNLSDLPSRITVHQSDALWKLTPLIKELSTGAIILHLPNNYLCHLEVALGLSFYPKALDSIEVHEYNNNARKLPSSFSSGINTKLGIIKLPFLPFPKSLVEKRDALCKEDSLAHIFQRSLDAPLYFGYAATASFQIVVSLRNIEILALFVELAKQKKQPHITIVLPISLSAVQDAIDCHPKIFNECRFYYKNRHEEKAWGTGHTQIDIYHLFPFSNHDFRALMDYAAACDTPIVVTGDQSFTELFFTIESSFVFIYQLLHHKKSLLEAICDLASDNRLTQLSILLTYLVRKKSETNILIKLANFLFKKWDALKEETTILTKEIQNQPDLIANLAQIINKTALKKQEGIAKKEHEEEETTSVSRMNAP